MKKHFFLTSLICLAFSFHACSGSEEAANNTGDEQEMYIFDDVAADTSEIVEKPIVEQELPIDTVEVVVSKLNEYIVQVGAFTTEERARNFVSQNQPLIQWKMGISYSTKVKYWVVQLPKFLTRTEAENVRNQLWQKEKFKDAFIVPEG